MDSRTQPLTMEVEVGSWSEVDLMRVLNVVVQAYMNRSAEVDPAAVARAVTWLHAKHVQGKANHDG